MPFNTNSLVPETAKAMTGIGLRHPHYQDILDQLPNVGWLEGHSENFFGAGGAPVYFLEKISQHYPISLHGVGLSLGSAEGLDKQHLNQLKTTVERFKPFLVSEHISFSHAGGQHVPDLLPVPFIEEAISTFTKNIDTVQQTLGRKILVENPSSYLEFTQSEMPETEFLSRIVEATGCGLLLDINNIYVSCHNLGHDAKDYLANIPAKAVGEIHLAGYHINTLDDGREVFIDTHSHPVHDPVWELYEHALNTLDIANTPTLIEWDADLPTLDVLVAEAEKANALRAKIKEETAHVA